MKEKNHSAPGLTADQWLAYERFAKAGKKAFSRIAYKTGGEHSAGDVEGDAILVALELRDRHGMEIEFESAAFQNTLLRHLYQKLVRYTDTNVRYAVRLDHSPYEEGESHPLAQQLASDASFDPLVALVANESAIDQNKVDQHPSLAAAYVRLLDHCNYRMSSMASHLLLSISHTYKRLAHANRLAFTQEPLSLPMPGKEFVPGPWRKFKLRRAQIQLSFDFEDEIPLLHS